MPPPQQVKPPACFAGGFSARAAARKEFFVLMNQKYYCHVCKKYCKEPHIGLHNQLELGLKTLKEIRIIEIPKSKFRFILT